MVSLFRVKTKNGMCMQRNLNLCWRIVSTRDSIMKHIKFEENIREDDSYNVDKVQKGSLTQKVADNALDSEFEVTETKKWYKDVRILQYLPLMLNWIISI